MSQFDDETSLLPQGPNSYAGATHASWNIGENLNGGYLMCLAASALRQMSPQHQDPFSVTVHYLRPGAGGRPCRVDVQPIRQGRTLSTGRATLYQDDIARIEMLAAFGDLGEPGTPLVTIPAPVIPSPEECLSRSGEAQGVFLPIMDRLDIRLDPAQAKPGAAGKAQVTGWIRFKDGRPPDTLAALLFADTFPPSVFSLLGVVGWVPTIEMTVHVRRRPAPGWMLGRFNTLDIEDGRMIEDGALWDSAGNLVVQVRQLALLRKP